MEYKKAKIMVQMEVEVDVPKHWDDGMIRFHYNDGSYCIDNLLHDLLSTEEDDNHSCACTYSTIRVLEVDN